MRSSGSRVDWIIFFGNFYEINSSQEFFLYCENFGVDGNFRLSQGHRAVLRAFS